MILKSFLDSDDSSMVLEIEPIVANIRIKENGKLVFSCQLTSTSMDSCRIGLANGFFTRKIRNMMNAFLSSQGFLTATYQRLQNGQMNDFSLDVKKAS